MAESIIVDKPHSSVMFPPKGLDKKLSKQSTKAGAKSSKQCWDPSIARIVANAVIICLLIGPLVVIYWRGTWGMTDVLVFPQDVERSAWTCIGLGFGVIFFYMILQEHFQTLLMLCCSSLDKSLVFVWLPFVYIIALSVVFSWRGVWYILDHYFTTSNWSALATHIIGVSIMVLTGTFTSVISVPGYVLRDHIIRPISFNLAAVGSSNLPQKNFLWKAFSCLFTVVIIGSGLIFYWRGTWTLLNNFSPKDVKYSLISLAVGYASVLNCYCVSMSDMLRVKLESNGIGLLSRFFENVFIYFLAFGVVNVWKGYWDLIDFVLLNLLYQSNHVLVFFFSCHMVGLVGLFALSSSINLVGCPAGCRISSETSLDGFNMGSFLDGLFEIFHDTPHENVVENEVIADMVTVL